MALIWNDFMEMWEEEELPSPSSEAKFPCDYELVIPKPRADKLLQVLSKLNGYTNRYRAPASTNRVYQAFSDRPDDLYYSDAFEGQVTSIHHWKDAPQELLQVRIELEEYCGKSLPYVLINKYQHCRVGMEPHRDEEDIGSFWPILGLSLGAERDFQVTNIKTNRDYSQLAQHGSVYTMPAGFQDGWLHEIPKSYDEELDTRISLTFRHPRKARVIHILSKWEKEEGRVQEPFDVYMGRGSYVVDGKWQTGEWGNPFSAGARSNAPIKVKYKEVIPRFQEWFVNRIRNENGFAAKVMSLGGKRLGCWCDTDMPCHAKIIASWVTLIAEKWNESQHDKIKMQQWLKEGGK